MVKIAVLDDYVSNAATSADWSELPADTSVDFFHEPLSEAEAGARLKDPMTIIRIWAIPLLGIAANVSGRTRLAH